MRLFFQKSLLLTFAFAFHFSAHAGLLEAHQGRWLGEMKVPDGPTLKLGAELFVRADGSYWASVSSPDQGVYDIPVKNIKQSDASLEFDLVFAALKLTWVKDHFDGQWLQGPTPLNLHMQQVAEFPKKTRPQTPSAPFPYEDIPLAITSTDGVTLGATLSIPNGQTKPTVVILVHGSGPGTRDEELAGHRPFAVLADDLARRGVAVLRYDKRGVLRSTGDYENHTLPQLVDDLNAVVKAMEARKQLSNIGLLGLSEGSQIAAEVAVRNPEAVKFVVSLAGTGLPGLEMLVLQDRVWAKDHGANPAEVEQLMVYVRKYYETILGNAEEKPRIDALKELYARLSPADRTLVEQHKMNEGTLSLSWAEKPFLRASLLSNPQLAWRGVQCPVLALNGSLDHHVPAKENLAGILAALRAGGNRKVESAELVSLNHLFQTAKTGAEDEYGEIAETIAPIVLQKVAQFVIKQH
ncbi:MAG: alpha/beta hydrolase [Burkholderiaceae bacterium]|nr:alpha/beta hydrolase [Burkholderiaceae bacterium]